MVSDNNATASAGTTSATSFEVTVRMAFGASTPRFFVIQPSVEGHVTFIS